jgi:uncharacterized protein GlcG (DUF336 family)
MFRFRRILFFLIFLLGGNRVSLAQELTVDDATQVVFSVARQFDIPYTIAVTNREGRPLAVFNKTGSPATTGSLVNFGVSQNTEDVAVNLARTAAFFSNNRAPLSSRTVRFISGIHFPPGVANTPNAALYGIENTNRGCNLTSDYLPGKEIPPARQLNDDPGIGIVTGKPDIVNSIPYPSRVNPGGIPLYRGNEVVGGVGVAGLEGFSDSPAAAMVEYAAFRGILEAGAPLGPLPNPLPAPGEVFIDGIRLPFVGRDKDQLQDFIEGIRPQGTPGRDTRPDVLLGTFTLGPIDSPTSGVPEGWLVLPRDGQILTAPEVEQIVLSSIRRANRTRAAIRLSPGQPAKMVIAVGDLDGTILGLYRMVDATVFSIDVAATKARNVVYFSSAAVDPADLPGVPPGTAVTARTLSFGAQPLFPAGIGGQPSFPPTPQDSIKEGPFFRSLYVPDVDNPCTQGRQPPNPNQSGIVLFPGSTPLYRNGALVGGLGISGDGVEQDDYVTAAGYAGFEPPPEIRADNVFVKGVRLPYFKFPRNPETGVIPDLSLPKTIYANLNMGGGPKGIGSPTLDIELVAGPEIDLEATALSLVVTIDGAPQMVLRDPEGFLADGSVGVTLPFFNFIRLETPDSFDPNSDVEIAIHPTDVLGRETEACLFLGTPPAGGGACVEITTFGAGAEEARSADFNRDRSVNAVDLLMLRDAATKSWKSGEYDLNGDGSLGPADLFEFGKNWLDSLAPAKSKGRKQ